MMLGLSARDFVKAVKSFYTSQSNAGTVPGLSTPTAIADQELEATDVASASVVWKWIVKRKDVIVSPKNLGHPSLEELLLPSQESSSTVAAPSSQRRNPNTDASSTRGETRLSLSEERQWKAIAGHGPDLKRIPLFEWRALVAIASIGEKGILQGDLVRLTGQDKRSLPMRTDALARKGYIIKQQAMLRGCRTSKLWLAQFANNARADVVRQGLPEEVLSIPLGEITKSWDPVSFRHYYLEENRPLDYFAISQTFLMIVKAYGAMRYCDIRHKMDINERISQMRALAKSSRWWARTGVVRFEPMKSNKQGKLFKDCVKFIRDPTKEEWAKYRGAPKANLKVPSSRVRSQNKLPPIKAESSAVTTAQPRRLGQKPLSKPSAPRIPPSPPLIRLSSWNPHKPLASTFIEIIRRNGGQGSSNTELGMFNLGWPYRKYISTLTTMISLPRSLPPHLQPFAIHSTFMRVGKTMTYNFHADETTMKNDIQALHTSGSQSQADETEEGILEAIEDVSDEFHFPDPSPGQFLKPGSRVKSFLPITGLGEVYRTGRKRFHEPEDDSTPASSKRAKVTSATASEAPLTESRQPEPIIPGVYYGVRNSLDPAKSKGRPKKSIVMKFVFPALKDPNFFNQGRRKSGNMATGVTDSQVAGHQDDIHKPCPTDAELSTVQNGSTPKRPPKRGRAGGSKFKCDSCGSSYKNINGLEYHQTKSQSACNPDWVPEPPKPALRFSTPKQQEKYAAEHLEEGAISSSQKPSATPGQVLPSRRPKLVTADVPKSTQKLGPRSRSIVALPVKLQNVLDLPTGNPTRSSPISLKVMKRAPEKPTKAPIIRSAPASIYMATHEQLRGSRTATETQCLVSQSTGQTSIDKTGSSQHIDPSQDPRALIDVTSPTSTLSNNANSSCPGDQIPDVIVSRDTRSSRGVISTQPSSGNPLRQTQKLYGRQKISAIRRELTTNLILGLLEQNDQVLPGDVSLYCLVASKWSGEADGTSVPVPEWKAFQTILKTLDKDRIISVHHFAKMSRGVLKKISVVHKGYYGNGATEMSENMNRKIHEVKNKYEELYPSPYIPSQLSLSGKESELCRSLARKCHNIEAPESSTNGSVSGPSVEQISTLGYDMPPERHINSSLAGTKRRQTEVDDLDEPQAPRLRKRGKLRSKDAELHQAGNKDTAETQRLNNMHKRQDMAKSRPGRRNSLSGESRWSIEYAPPGMAQALEAASSIHFITPMTVSMYENGAVLTDDLSEDEEDLEQETSPAHGDVEFDAMTMGNGSFSFAPVGTITAFEDGIWPGQFPRGFFMNRPGGSLTMAGRFPESRWFLMQNLPQSMSEMVDSTQFRRDPSRRDITRYGQFGADVEAIEAWERSPEGAYLQNLGNIAPDYIFISLSTEAGVSHMKPVDAEWSPDYGYTVNNVPDDIRYASSEDDGPLPQAEQIVVNEGPKRRAKGTGGRRRPFVKRSDGNWKHRTLFPIVKRETGRWNKEKAVGANIGREKETELVVAIVIIRKLLGGVDKITDWGMFLKLYPEWSISGIRKFWIRVTKERASYIEALSNKFHVAFLEAYETGELAPLNYEDIGNYDWRTLIDWGIKLETHHGIELPTTRQRFDAEYTLANPKKDEEDWRELWFHFQTSTYDRLDAASSLAVVMPVTENPASDPITEADLQLARSWVRALCNNKTQSTVGAEVRQRLLQLGGRAKATMNVLLERAVSQLLDNKVISKIFGKGFGQVFKLNNHYELRLKKFTHIEKYTQAMAFKAKLDESFRNNAHVSIPINSDDGMIMAMINLQACGRVRLDDINFPNVPFGFEPGNYEGRKYPKRYYLFDVKVVPTDSYIYNEDLPIVHQAEYVPIPTKGPLGEIPIWCDFFGNLDRTRWAHYVCMVAFALSVKGPLAVSSSVDLLNPVIEAFETQLVMDWLDAVGILERASTNYGATVGEWWWLVAGKQLDVKGKAVARA